MQSIRAPTRLKILCQHMISRSVSSKINVNGVDLAYQKVGTGQHVVLLLPGALGCGETDFSPQINGLDRDKLTIVSWDPRGYGRSIPPDRDFPVDFFYRDAHDAAGLMKNLGFAKYSLLGWSDGGNTAGIVAAKYPNNIDKLILWGSNSFITKEDMDLFEKVRDISRWSEAMRKPMIDIYGEEYFRQKWSDWVERLHQIFNERNGDIFRKELEHICAPTLIIHGEKDAMVPRFHPEYLHKNIKGSIIDYWENAKHNLHLKYADRFNAQVENFLLK
uniref:LOW QUALITY PROTEIN: valacyclovir hydrolase-like n=1 Tax=Styela clava TaxID=7725 RepID=UPI00193A70FD|nr:LOW QUALITY PROTEIN: valacyclovir hydrolase-like [Styela clava]